MPNWCFVTYCCKGDKKDLDSLLGALKRMQARKFPVIENGFGIMWLGELVNELGYNYEDYRCRGEITDFSMEGDRLYISYEGAWCEQEGVRKCIEDKFPSVRVDFSSEEPGMCEYFTTSFEIFPERYIVDSGLEGQEYYTDFEDAVSALTELTNIPDISKSNIQSILEDWNDKCDDDSYIHFHEFILTEQ